MEQLGQEKRHILASRIEKGQSAQHAAKEQFQTTLERFQTLTDFDGGELETVYKSLASELERCEARAKAVNGRIAAIDAVGGDMFREWQGEIALIQRADLRRQSGERLQSTQAQYDRMLAAMHTAEQRMEPVLGAFRDQVLFLKHNLNARAIGSLADSVAGVEDDVARLVDDMQLAISEADRFLGEMGS